MQKLDEVRCSTCRRLLARGTYEQIEIKCPRCRAINLFTIQRAKSLPKAQSLPVERRSAPDVKEASCVICTTL